MGKKEAVTEEEFLKDYDPSAFERPSIAVDVLVFTTEKTALKILLVRRSGMPFQGRWSLPGTFIRMEETAEQAAERALSDKTGAERIFLEQLYTFTALDRDPRMRIISVAYMAMVPACRLFFKAGSDKGQAMLFDVVRGREEGILLVSGDISLSLSDLAFDHGKILETALERMAGKIEYTDIGYEFLEDKDRFTLSELRNIYDAVTGKSYDIGNFRRFIKNRYIVPGKIVNNHEEWKEDEKRKVGRPGVTYRYTGVNRNRPGVNTRQ